MSDLVAILRFQRNRLLVTQDQEFMRLVEEDHKCFKRAISKETALRQIFEEHDCHTSFSEVKTRFPHLIAFSGRFATVFPGTAVVEPDFSVLKCE